MRDYFSYRLHLVLKRVLMAVLRTALRLVVRLRPASRPASRPAVVTGSVVLLDRCLGLGDVLMISPALRLLAPLGPVTVVAALPPLLAWDGEWLRCPDWALMKAEVDRLAGSGRLVLVPRLGVGGLLALLTWRGGNASGIIGLDSSTWLDASGGGGGAIVGRHYTDGAVACARALLRLAGKAGADQAVAITPERIAPMVGALPAGVDLPAGSVVALAPWATSRIRRWPLAHWSALITRLALDRPDLRFVLLGSAEERRFGEEIAVASACPLNLMGRLSLAETTAVIARAAVLVACDNGLMHIALGTKTPLVALFGSTDPGLRLVGEGSLVGEGWRLAYDPSLCPWGRSPCYPDLHRDPSCPGAVECLSGISPDRVAGLVMELLTVDQHA